MSALTEPLLRAVLPRASTTRLTSRHEVVTSAGDADRAGGGAVLQRGGDYSPRQASRRELIDEVLGDSPWRVRDLARLGARVGVALVGLIVSYAGISDTALWKTQLIWLAIGVGFTTILGGSAVAWLLTGMSVLGRERVEIQREIARLYALDPRRADERAHHALDPYPMGDESLAEEFVTADGMRRYHRPTCDIVAGKRTYPVNLSQVTRLELVPCGMCSA